MNLKTEIVTTDDPDDSDGTEFVMITPDTFRVRILIFTSKNWD